MNKSDLVAHVASDVNLPRTKVGPVVDAVVQCIARALQAGDEVRIHGPCARRGGASAPPFPPALDS